MSYMTGKDLICPVSDERVSEQIVRCNALLTIVLVSVSIIFGSPLLLLLLVADFFIRAFTNFPTSPLSYVSKQVVSWLKLQTKTIDKAPKIFAARLGFLMSAAILSLYILGYFQASLVVAGILSLFAFLELAIGFCAGCFLYTYLVFPYLRRE